MAGTLAERVQAAIDARGITKYRLEKAAGVSAGYVTRLLKGEREKIRPGTASKLAAALNVSEGWLVFGVGPMSPQDGPAELVARLSALDIAAAYLGDRLAPKVIEVAQKWASRQRAAGHDLTRYEPVAWGRLLVQLQRKAVAGDELEIPDLPKGEGGAEVVKLHKLVAHEDSDDLPDPSALVG